MKHAASAAALSFPTLGGSPAYQEKVALIRDALQSATSVASMAHPFSDGDALGSQLALHQYARLQAKTCWTLNFDPIPPQISWLPGTTDLVDHLPDGVKVDVLFLMETTDAARLGNRVDLFERARLRIHLDHHPGIQCQGDINLLDEEASSTCEILYNILHHGTLPLPLEVLEPLYVGIMTDTGNFRYANTTVAAHRIAAEMIGAGLQIPAIFKKVYESNTHKRVLMHGLAMSRTCTLAGGRLIYSWLSEEDFATLGASELDSDGCISHLCSIVGMEVAVMFRELPDRRIKASFRSAGRVDVQELARRFGGGGHRSAASGTVEKPMDEARRLVLAATEHALASLG